MRNTVFHIIFALILGISVGVLGFLGYKSLINHAPPAVIIVDEINRIVHPKIKFGFLPYWLIAQVSEDALKSMTHIAYFGLVIGPDGHLQKLVNTKEKEPGWTTLKSGGFNKAVQEAEDKPVLSLVIHLADDSVITELLSHPEESARNLMADTQPIMNEYGFRDLNLDIESFRKATPEAQLAFTDLVESVSKVMKAQELGTLSIDVLPRSYISEFLLKPENIEPYVDYLVIMAYDYSYSGSQYTGPVSPLGGVPHVRSLDVPVTLGETLRKTPKEKVVLALPLYGYEWDSLSATCPGPVIPGTGKTASAKRTAETVSLCTDCTSTFDEVSMTTCIVKPWDSGVYYSHFYSENNQSLQAKLDFVKKYDLAGSAFWALGYESADMIKALRSDL